MCCEDCSKYDECEYRDTGYQERGCCSDCEYYEECYGEEYGYYDEEEEEDCDDYAYDDPCWDDDEDEDD